MNKVQKKINELVATGYLKYDDPKFNFFKERIVPSVVNKWITPRGVNSHSFKCPFEQCAALFSRSRSLERHLREQHYEQIPKGVFGYLNNHKCIPCDRSFIRLEHWNQHLTGRKHLRALIVQGIIFFILIY